MKARTAALVLALLMVASTLAAGAPVGEGDLHPIPEMYVGPTYYGYIVVAPDAWRDEIQPLLDWRTMTSDLEVIFLSYEDALSHGEGRDNAAKLKDYIHDSKPLHGDTIIILLLVGDSEVIPVRRVFTDILQDGNLSDPLNYRWTDSYYTYGEEEDWDKDGDGTYGEDGEVLNDLPDAFPEDTFEFAETWWRVGRIPASTELELERFIDKLLAYERDPPPGDWFTSALFVSGLMDVPNHLDNPYTPGLDGGYELFSDNSYESHGKLQDIIPERYSRTWLYDYPHLEGGQWNRSVDTLDHGSMVNAFDRGHSIVAMNGHGWIDGSGLAHYNGSGYSNYWWDWHTAYDYADADSAGNGGRLPWVYIAACYVGDITVEDDRTLERLVMNPDGGAIGMVAGNGENYKGESMANTSFGNWFLERAFWSNYFARGAGHGAVGAALENALWAYLEMVSSDDVPHTPLYDAYYAADFLSHNLLGDPMTRVWTDVPQEFQRDQIDVEDLPWIGEDKLRVHVHRDPGEPLLRANVYVGWDGGHAVGTTVREGFVDLEVPLDAGELTIVISKGNYLPLIFDMERPVDRPDLELAGISIRVGDDGWGQDPLMGEEVNLTASVSVNGRYDYDQARLRFSVAPEGGDFERLIPDSFAPILTGTRPVAERAWTPPWPGVWKVRAEVDPADEHPDADPSNDVAETTIVVLGPPAWIGTPAYIEMDCGDGPGASVDLRQHFEDPDTPVEELEIEVFHSGDPATTGVVIHSENGLLSACTQLPLVEVKVLVVVSDGTYTRDYDVTLRLTRNGVPRLRIIGQTHHDMVQGGTAAGHLTIENLGPGPADGVRIVAVDGHPDLSLSPDGSYTFEARTPGTHVVRLAVERSDGTTEDVWESTTMLFEVTPGPGAAPMPYGWKQLRIAAGEKATIQLQALDLEGGTVTFSIDDDDGLGATVDPDTGLLTLRPSRGATGDHVVMVRLSDGTMSEDYSLQVIVTEAPSSTGYIWLVVIVIIVAIVAILVALELLVWHRWIGE